MPRTAEDVENYLIQLDRRYEREGATFFLHSDQATTIALMVTPPIVMLRVDIGFAPQEESRQAPFFRQLLEYNATDLMHVFYGLDGDRVVLSCALELANLDMNELEAALSDTDLALARHVSTLHELAGHDDRRSHRPASS